MGIKGYMPSSEPAKAVMDLAQQHNLSDNLVPSLSDAGDIVLGVVCESQTQAFEFGRIFTACGPCSVERWGITQIFSFRNARISRIGMSGASSH